MRKFSGWAVLVLLSALAFVAFLLARMRAAEAGPRIAFDSAVPKSAQDIIVGLVQAIPAGAHRTMRRAGVKIRVVQYLHTNLGLGPDPDTRKWDEVGGAYLHAARTVFIATHIKIGGVGTEKTIEQNRRTVLHEVGHVVDYAGQYTQKSKICKLAYQADRQQVLSGQRPAFIEFYIDARDGARYEVFAQAFANLQGAFNPDILGHFPRMSKFVQAKTV